MAEHAYRVEGRRILTPWITEATIILAPDALQAMITAATHPRFRNCWVTSALQY